MCPFITMCSHLSLSDVLLRTISLLMKKNDTVQFAHICMEVLSPRDVDRLYLSSFAVNF
jgi:hypothetical protein